jgi:hypothetical protein
MNYNEFAFWLKGYLVGKTTLNEAELEEVAKQLKTASHYNFGSWGFLGGSYETPLKFNQDIKPAASQFPIVMGT